MEWRTFNQRIILLLLLGIVVIGLIAAGQEPYVALAIAGGIVMLLKDAWLPGGSRDERKSAGGRRATSTLASADDTADDGGTPNLSDGSETPEGEDK
ncbi:hypothetical protein [Streptomyces sp. E2N166]|uniref:hypothetical protein n=1 Tax=Streptomyces sp. E2N166 TaxID=1851909 RepID=UPI000EF68A05|nr:hypothetical protein [Streptomyces sp. E2N166]